MIIEETNPPSNIEIEYCYVILTDEIVNVTITFEEDVLDLVLNDIITVKGVVFDLEQLSSTSYTVKFKALEDILDPNTPIIALSPRFDIPVDNPDSGTYSNGYTIVVTTSPCSILSPTITSSITPNTIEPTIECNDIKVTVNRREYSIVGDGVYISSTGEVTPQWLYDVIDNNINEVVTDVTTSKINEINDAIDILRDDLLTGNTGFNSRLDMVETATETIGYKYDTLEGYFEDNKADIIRLDSVKITADQATALSIQALQSELTLPNGQTNLKSTLNNIQTTQSNDRESFAEDIGVLTSQISSPEYGLVANANATTNLYTYTGFDEYGTIANTGLARTVEELIVGVNALTNQVDGSVMIHAFQHGPVTILQELVDIYPTYNVIAKTETLQNVEGIYGAFKAVLYTTVAAPTTTSSTYYPLQMYLYGVDEYANLNGNYASGTTCVMKVYVDGGLDPYNNTIWYLGYVSSVFTLPANKNTVTNFGAIGPTNFTANTKPLANKEPYKGWYDIDIANGDDAVRTVHIGDTFIYLNSVGQYVKSFKFVQTTIDPLRTDADGYAWYEIKDSIALIAATQAQALADGKMRVFATTPKGPYQIGDLWVKNIGQTKQEIWTSTVDRELGFEESDWTLSATDDTLVNSFLLDGTYLNLQQAAITENGTTVSFTDFLATELDKNVNVYSGKNSPFTHSFGTSLLQENDIYLWFTTATTESGIAYDYTRTYKFNNNSWNEITSNDNLTALADLADGKRTIFGGTTIPTTGQKNDIWIPSDTVTIGEYTYLKGEIYSANTSTQAIPVNDILSHLNTGTSITIEVKGTFNTEVATFSLNSANYSDVTFPISSNELVKMFNYLLELHKNEIIYEDVLVGTIFTGIRLHTYNNIEYLIGLNLSSSYNVSIEFIIYNINGTPSFIKWNNSGQTTNFTTSVQTGLIIWEPSTRYTNNITNLIDNLNTNVIPGLQAQLDSQTDYWFFDSNKNENIIITSSSDVWDEALKVAHQGDLAFDTYLEKGYYYDRNIGDGTWVEITGTTNLGLIQALKNASLAQATADGKMSVYFAIEVAQNLNPGNIDNIKYWFFSGHLKRISDNSTVLAKDGDELTTVIINGTKKDYYVYTYSETNGWLLNTPAGLVAKAGWSVDLDAYLKDPNTGTFGGNSTLSTTIVTNSNNKVETAFAYNTSTKEIGGKYHDAGFGLRTLSGDGSLSSPYNSEFWIAANKFKISDSQGGVPVFSIDAPSRSAVFSGKVMFNSGSGPTAVSLESAVQNYVEQVSVGDKNINITDNLIPTDSLLTDVNNAGYQFISTPTKSNAAGIDTFAEPQIVLDGSDEVYSPYLDEIQMAYYYRIGIKGVTSLDRFKIVTINSSNVATSNNIVYTLNSGQTLSASNWYIIDGIINPIGGNTSASGSIRNANGIKIGTINNFVQPSDTTKFVLGWISSCTISRMKIAKITADTLVGNYTTQDYVDSSLLSSFNTLKSTEEARDGLINTFYTTAAPTSGMNFGDYWLDTDDSSYTVKRYQGTNGQNTGTLAWVTVTSAAAKALQNAYAASAAASLAQSTADGKIDTFYQATAPTVASEGDIWFDTDDGNKIYTRRSSAWVVTQDSAIATAISAASTAQSTADGKAVVHYSTTAPINKSATDIGDLWVDTDDGNKLYTWTGTAWSLSQDSAGALSVANTKTATFYSDTVPTATTVGDLWIDTSTNKYYKAASVGANEIKAGEWVLVQDISNIATTAASTAVSNINWQTNVQSALDNNQTIIDGDKLATGSIWVGGNVKTYNYNWNSGHPLGFGLFSEGENDSLQDYNIVGGKIYGGQIDGAIISGAIFDISTAKMQSTYAGNLGSFFPASYTSSIGTVYSNYFYSPSYGSGYNANRITRDNTEFLIQVHSSSTFYLAYQINDGTWIEFSDTPSSSPIPNAYAGSYTFNFIGGKIRFRAVGSGRTSLVVTAPSTYVNRYSALYTNFGTYSFTVPAGITQLTYVVYGAGGGAGASNSDGDCHTGSGGGAGGKSIGTLIVTPNETLTVIVGEKGYAASFRFNSNYQYNYNAQGQAITLGSGTAGGASYLKRGSTTLATATGGGAGCQFCGGGAGGTPVVEGTNNGYGTSWVMYAASASTGGTNNSGIPATVWSNGSGYGNGGGCPGCGKGANGQNGAVLIYWEVNT